MQEPLPRARAWSRAEKLPLHFLILCAPFSSKRKRQFFYEVGRCKAVAGCGSAQILFLGFVNEIR